MNGTRGERAIKGAERNKVYGIRLAVPATAKPLI